MGHPLNPIGCLFLTLTEACRLEEENCLEISGIKCSSWILSWQLWLRWVQIWGSGHLDSESPLCQGRAGTWEGSGVSCVPC